MSSDSVGLVVDVLSYLVFSAIIFAFFVLLAVLFAGKKKNSLLNTFSTFLSDNILSVVFLFACVATLGSLFMSEVAGFVPCKLCWFQRIFMYPVAIISGIALIRGDKKIFYYILPLVVLGLGVAVYHYLVQMFPEAIQCSDAVALCSARQYAGFGFITIPFMSGMAFVNILLLSIFALRKR